MHDTRLLLQRIPPSNPLSRFLKSLLLFLCGQLFLRRDVHTKSNSWSLSNTFQPGLKMRKLVNGFDTIARPAFAPEYFVKVL